MGGKMIIELTWTEFKPYLDSAKLKWAHKLQADGNYELYAMYEGLNLKTLLYSGTSDFTDFTTNYLPNAHQRSSVKTSAFSNKEEDGKKIFTRTHGQTESLAAGSNTIDFNISYPQVKFNALEVVGCELGDTVSLQVLDTPTGTISTVPNYMLNQFGFNVGLPDNFYVRESSYDADLMEDMKIRIIYDSATAKDITINFILHELK